MDIHSTSTTVPRQVDIIRPTAAISSSSVLFAFLLLVSAIAVEAVEPPPAHPTPPDERSLETLMDALGAHGGPDVIRDLETLAVTIRGTVDQSAEVQGASPAEPCLRSWEEWIFYDREGPSVARRVKASRNDHSWRWRQTMLAAHERTFVDYVGRRARRSWDPEAAVERNGILRRFPQFALRHAMENVATLRWIGERQMDDATVQIIAYHLPGGDEITLLVDEETSAVQGIETTIDFPTGGDAVVAWSFTGFRSVEPLGLFPTGHRVTVDGRTWVEAAYTDITADAPLPAEAFGLPEDVPEPPAATPPESSPTPDDGPGGMVSTLAPGVFLATNVGGFNALFVELDAFVLAFEAPAAYPWLETIPPGNQAPSSALGERIVDLIHESVPGKPIRYLGFSHHHSDHLGGARAFVAAGATVLTTPGNRALVEGLSTSAHTRTPDRLVASPRAAEIEVFEGRRVVSDGERTVELLDIGPNPHTEEMVVLWLPKEKILYQGDLFYPIPIDYFPPQGRVEIMRHFVGWLDEQQIEPELIVGSHGPWQGTAEHLAAIRSVAP